MPQGHPFVCTVCRRVIHDPVKQYTERVEYRRLDGLKRRALFTVRDLCEECVDGVIEEKRNPHRVEQPDLFSQMEFLTEADDSL